MAEKICHLCGSALKSGMCSKPSCPSNALREWTEGRVEKEKEGVKEGDVLAGSCGLFPGHHGEKVVEGVGEDWVVVRMEYGGPWMVEGASIRQKLLPYLKKEEVDGKPGKRKT